MNSLQERILSDGEILGDDILKVDSFLNHQIDIQLLKDMGKDFYNIFSDYNINKILTVESSGIAIACYAAEHFGVPVVFAKKSGHRNIGNDVYTAEVFSFTKGETYEICVSKKYINAGDRILFVDDFLANGQAALGIAKIIKNAGAELVACGFAIEKGFQPGGQRLSQAGIKHESLAIVDSIGNGTIKFREGTV